MSLGGFLLLGADGQIGYELERELCIHGRVIPITRAQCDLADLDAVRRLIRAHAGATIVNAAAYTAVDLAESDADAAFQLNERLPAMLAEEARAQRSLLMHFSTDYVFDGEKGSPYDEEDAPAPLNVYGKSKLAGEQRVRESGVDHLIVRTSWVYGARGRNFLRTILAAAQTEAPLRVVADQRGAPTWSRMVASGAVRMLVAVQGASSAQRATVLGTYHLTASGSTTWHGFAERIVELASGAGQVPGREVVAIDSSELGSPARRPRMSLLSNEKAERVFGVRLPSWEEQLRMVLAP